MNDVQHNTLLGVIYNFVKSLIEPETMEKLIQKIFNELDSSAQIVIFSATYTDEILKIADEITSEPKKKILMKHEDLSLDLIKQIIILCLIQIQLKLQS